MPGSHIPAPHGTTWSTSGHKEGPTPCSPQVLIKSPELGMLLWPLLPHQPKQDGQSQGCSWESSREGSRAPPPVSSCSGCPHGHLGVTHSVCSEPQVSPARSSAAIEGLHWPQSHLSLITQVALGSSPPSQSFRIWDGLFTSSCREAPQRTLNSTQRTCALRAPAPACLCRCDT